MLRFKGLALLCTLLGFAAWQAQVLADGITTICPPNGGDSDSDRDGNDTDLCHSFQALRDSIDLNALSDLVQSHYQCNAKFRKALCYYNTSHFQVITQQLEQSEAYLRLLEELNAAGVNTSDIDNIMDIFECIQLPPPQTDRKCNCKELKGHTFLGDLLALMPHQQVHEFTSAAKARHTNFGLFVNTVTSSQFQARFRANMMKRDAVRPLKTMRRNGWDVPELLRAVMNILTW